MLVVHAPAKVNLFLDVLGKRPDGYHELSTLFERVSLCDRLSFSPSAKIVLSTDSRHIPTGPKNLVVRAARLLKSRYGVKAGVRIRLNKRIPVAAGLGGGSSDCAAALLGLNRFWRLGLSQKTLLEHAAELGSDVPFFILESPFAYARGRGERLEPIRARGVRFRHVIVKPRFKISTQEAFGALKGLRLTVPRGNVKMRIHSILKGSRGHLAGLLTNSLEAALNKRLTEIQKIKTALTGQGAAASLLSGSGSAVFGIFVSDRAAEKAARLFRKKHRSWQVFTATTY